MEQVFCKRKHDAIAVAPEQLSLIPEVSPERKRLRAAVGVKPQTSPVAIEPVAAPADAPLVVEEASGKKRKSADDVVPAKRTREAEIVPTQLTENDGVNSDYDDDGGDDEDVLPKYRVIDMPLSLRAQAYLQGAKGRSSADQRTTAGALVLYSPRPSVCQTPAAAAAAAAVADQTEEDVKMAQSRSPSPTPSATMDVD
ncbi:hypothetical protein LPJ53_004111 [Coemansia erecta]|uniref:Uncharacterized protein n=1 Tax=Coemansia erecta TaxID=147472 RepID=A0A9W7XZS5_9FUNG|nr:hypothetical protein LPJ53_004111 [Coemansia erecta]